MAFATSPEPPPAPDASHASHARQDHPANGRSTKGRSDDARPYDHGLVLDLEQRDHLVELQLAGDLDLASAGRLTAAMAWLRRRWRHTIVIDTTRLDFVDLAGYRALKNSVYGPDGTRDPRVVYVVGAALARLLHHLRMATGTLSPRLS